MFFKLHDLGGFCALELVWAPALASLARSGGLVAHSDVLQIQPRSFMTWAVSVSWRLSGLLPWRPWLALGAYYFN